ncbi:hypothetical protein [Subdoligranulum variabile]|uniref:Gp5/Type VI secretion system Vgr protein OB-fold domain-containing protein n=1 Tax=Subdoligranulum variabile DSM 15176 TaxID=411471 RepID=D1PRA3_9FIRM|nr:hypothetical protein [Subdoligranulum variabile]EFB74805.1 hypothetical protein SUBVAR_06932 [Subdoligranulum variabile DSM 15176]UWP66971.1 hypothetical protein NQ490_08415 [Subdoligranulum variabile]
MIQYLLVLPDGSELSSGVPGRNALRSLQWTHTVNAGTDLTPGSACADSLEAELWVEPGRSPGITAGQELTLCRVEGATRTRLGIFVAETPTRGKRNLYRLTAYDRMVRTEQDLSPWLRERQGDFPMTLDAFVQQVADACGVPLAGGLPRNGSYSVQAFYADGLTGRQLLQWAAQAAGCFVHCNADGALAFGWYTDARGSVSLTPGSTAEAALGQAAPYREDGLSYEDYETAPIQKVQIRQSDADLGVVWPEEADGTNTLVVQGNLLLTAETDAALRPVAQALYEAASGWASYTPCTVSAFADCPVTAGQLVWAVTPAGQRLTVCVMSAVCTAAETRLEATGNPRRDSVAAVNSGRLNLQGKMLEMKATIDGLSVKASTLSGDYTELRQSVEEISLSVVTEGNIRSKFAADATSVTIESGTITFAANSLVVDSDNFQLDHQGNVRITGSFYSNAANGNQVNLADGIAAFYARDSSGQSYPTTIITRSASANPYGILDVYGRAASGAVNTQVRLQGGLTDGSIHLYNAFGTEQGVLTSGEGNVSWLAGGLDVRGSHGVQAYYGSIGRLQITELGVNGGVIQKVYWKWDGNLGAYVLSTSS